MSVVGSGCLDRVVWVLHGVVGLVVRVVERIIVRALVVVQR